MKHVGGGWYELPDGRKIQGQDAAAEALAEEKQADTDAERVIDKGHGAAQVSDELGLSKAQVLDMVRDERERRSRASQKGNERDRQPSEPHVRIKRVGWENASWSVHGVPYSIRFDEDAEAVVNEDDFENWVARHASAEGVVQI